MSKTPNDQLLYELIHSLTKSEKRSFKLYAKRIGGKDEAKFIKLFDVLEKSKGYDEATILKKLPGVSKSQFSNLKSHLYKQVLASLRLSNIKHDIDIELREQLDHIRVLYKKGLYYQSLRLLNKAKNLTGNYRKDLFQLALLDYEKQIRSQQVFDLEEDYAEAIDIETEESLQRFKNVQKFFTLATKMKARFIERGMVKNEAEMLEIQTSFQKELPDYNPDKLAFNEQFYLYRAYYWLSYLTYDFKACLSYSEQWVELFQETGLDEKRRAGYLKGLNRVLQSAFRINDFEKFEHYWATLKTFEEEQSSSLASNTAFLLMKYKCLQQFNYAFLFNEFKSSKAVIEQLLAEIKLNRTTIDSHNLMVIYYKACVYYYAIGNLKKTREYLDYVINAKTQLRTDLKGFARIIDIIIDYENGDEELLDSKIKSARKFIDNADNLGEFQHNILDFIEKIGTILPHDLKDEFEELRKKLDLLRFDKFNAKPLLYFDFSSWIVAQIEGSSFGEIVTERKA